MRFENKPVLPIIHGVGGDLCDKKFLPAIVTVYQNWLGSGRRFPDQILVTDIKPEKLQAVPTLLDNVMRRHEGQLADAQKADLKKRFVAVSEAELAERIGIAARNNQEMSFLPYLAVPYTANLSVLKFYSRFRNPPPGLGERIFPTLEKPAALSVDQMAEIRRALLTAGIPEGNACITEHFIGKEGFDQLLQFMYGNHTAREILRYMHVKRVKITVREKLGGDDREYWGIMGDSLFNHGAALVGAILGNPADQLYKSLGDSITGRLRLLTAPGSDLSRLNPHGIYAHCRQDHPNTPTGVLLRFNPRSPRWGNTENGGTEWVVEWGKNTPEKVTRVSFEFKGGEVWTFNLDYFNEDNERCWGYTKTSTIRGSNGTPETVVERFSRKVSGRMGDGYPWVVQNYLLGDSTHFMPLEFQDASNRFFGPIAEVLDHTPMSDRIYFDKGFLPFASMDPNTLPKLEY